MEAVSRPPLFLTVEELVELTGRKSVRHQVEWLKGKGWKYEVSAAGKPIVARSYAEYRLGSGVNPNERRFRPDLAAADAA